MTTDDLITAILKNEGSRYTDHAADKGGPTRYGITQATLTAYRGHPVTPVDVASLTEAEARAIYEQDYIKGPGFDRIGSDALRFVLVDYAVNSGPITAIRALQRTLGVPVDGNLGPVTEQAANLKDGRRLALGVLAQRARHFGRIITDNPTQAMFAAGWMDRLARQVEELA